MTVRFTRLDDMVMRIGMFIGALVRCFMTLFFGSAVAPPNFGYIYSPFGITVTLISPGSPKYLLSVGLFGFGFHFPPQALLPPADTLYTNIVS